MRRCLALRHPLAAELALDLVLSAKIHLAAANERARQRPDPLTLGPVARVRADAKRLDDPPKAAVRALVSAVRPRGPLAFVVVPTVARRAKQNRRNGLLGGEDHGVPFGVQTLAQNSSRRSLRRNSASRSA